MNVFKVKNKLIIIGGIDVPYRWEKTYSLLTINGLTSVKSESCMLVHVQASGQEITLLNIPKGGNRDLMHTLISDLTYKKIASNIPSSTKYTIPSEYKMAILVATINYPNAISPQFTFMFPNLTETNRISDGYWHDNTYHASFMACNDGNVVYFASNWQVVSPTGTVTYDVYAR